MKINHSVDKFYFCIFDTLLQLRECIRIYFFSHFFIHLHIHMYVHILRALFLCRQFNTQQIFGRFYCFINCGLVSYKMWNNLICLGPDSHSQPKTREKYFRIRC